MMPRPTKMLPAALMAATVAVIPPAPAVALAQVGPPPHPAPTVAVATPVSVASVTPAPPLPRAHPGAPLAHERVPLAHPGNELRIRYAEYGALQEVDGEALYRSAREALSRSQYAQASALFARLRGDFPSSALVGDSYYYQAFALYRHGRSQNEARARALYEQAVELLSAQADRHRNAATRQDAAELLMRVESELARAGDHRARAAVQAGAQEACTDEESGMRAMALSALMSMDAERAVPLLREVIANQDECLGEFRAQAVFMLVQHEPEEAVDVLLDIVQNDPDPGVRQASVMWLAEVDSPEATEALLAIMDSSDDDEMMHGALFALAQKDDPRARDALRRLGRRTDAPVESRAMALFWLAESTEDELPYLREIYRDLDEPELRQHVMMAVGQVDGPEATAFLREVATDRTADREARAQAVMWLAQRDVSVSDLKSIYDAADSREIRVHVLMGVSQMDSPEAVDLLMQIARSDDDTELRQQAVFLLGQSDDPRVPAFLLEIIGR